MMRTALILLMLAGLAAQGCAPAPAETGDEAKPAPAPTGFAVQSRTESDDAYTYAVDVQDSIAVFGRGHGVVIVDVADPAHPRVLGSIATAGEVRDVALDGFFAYIAADSGGLQIVGLRDPSAPSIAGQMRFADRAFAVDVSNGRAYVAARSEGLRIIDVSDPSALAEIGQFATPDEAVDVVIRGDFAYVAAWYESMRVMDISDPEALEEVSFASYDSYDNGAAWSVHVDGDLAVQAVPDMGLRTVDISDPRNVKLHKVYRGLFAPAGAAVRGRTAFVADQDEGFRVLDLADPVRPVEIGALEIPGRAMSVTLAGDVAYVAAREGGLRIVDISRPNDPRAISFIDGADEVVDLAGVGDAIVAAGRQNGVALRRLPSLEASAFVGHPATRAVVNEATLVVGGRRSLASYDLANGQTLSASTTVDGTVQGIAAHGDLLVVAVERFGLRVFRMGDLREVATFMPERAEIAASGGVQMLRTPVAAWDVLMDGELAIAAFDDGIRVIDLSSPAQPRLVGRLATPERAYRLALRGTRLFAACDDGLRVIDITAPAQPILVSRLKTPSFASALALDDERVYVGDLSGFVTIAAIDHPQERIGAVKVADQILSLAVVENGLSVAAGRQGVLIVDIATSFKDD